jgi:hypothetical protein
MSPHDQQPSDERDPRVEDLRSTGDSIRTDLRRLQEIEAEKATLPAADPKVDELSEAAVEAADRIARETRVERDLSDQLG